MPQNIRMMGIELAKQMVDVVGMTRGKVVLRKHLMLGF